MCNTYHIYTYLISVWCGECTRPNAIIILVSVNGGQAVGQPHRGSAAKFLTDLR